MQLANSPGMVSSVDRAVTPSNALVELLSHLALQCRRKVGEAFRLFQFTGVFGKNTRTEDR